MATVLICLQPFAGHVNPAMPLVRGLVEAGHRVVVMTGRDHADAVRRAGGDPVGLPPGTDTADPEVVRRLARRSELGLLARMRDDLAGFVEPMAEQSRVIDAVVAERGVDVVVADPMFFGALPQALRAEGPPVLVLGLLPLMRPGGGSMQGHAERWIMTRLLRPVQRLAREQAARRGVVLDRFFMWWTAASDGVLQLSGPTFEPAARGGGGGAPVHFVGPMTRSDGALPPWWTELRTDRPTVLVTQGTLANADAAELIDPALAALADAPANVVVTTGGGATPSVVPSNTWVADHLPLDSVLHRCALLLTNGGYGGVQLALRHGVPVALVGATEDKAEVLARLRSSGAGEGIRTVHPRPRQVRRLVEQILGDERYRRRATALSEEIERCGGVAAAVEIITGAARSSSVRVQRPRAECGRVQGDTCWVVYIGPADHGAGWSSGLKPVAAASTEEQAHQLLERLLSVTPGRANLIEDYPYRADDERHGGGAGSGRTVHLVVTLDDGPSVSTVFDSIDEAGRHADDLRRLGEAGVTIIDMVMDVLPS